jgi:hypothetical protein
MRPRWRLRHNTESMPHSGASGSRRRQRRRSVHLATESRQGPAVPGRRSPQAGSSVLTKAHIARRCGSVTLRAMAQRCGHVTGLIETEGDAGDCCDIARRLLENAVGDAARTTSLSIARNGCLAQAKYQCRCKARGLVREVIVAHQ